MTGHFEPMTMADGASVSVYHVPAEGARRGGLVLIQEIFGVTEHIRAQCESYAAEGYEMLCPALFDREHPGFEAGYDGPGYARGSQLARELHPIELSVADIQTCIDRLAPSGPVFVVGYCYGGTLGWLTATRLQGAAAVSAYYGGNIPQLADEEPRVPIIMHFGRHDSHIPMDGVETVEAKAWPNATVYVYEAGHGFNSDRRADYHEPSADLARARTLALFRAHGG